MTVKEQRLVSSAVRAALKQVLIVVLINVPAVSFGLALGWVSLASGEAAAEGGGGEDGEARAGRGAVVAAVTTFTATLAGVPLSARALRAGRKVALIATSAAFVICWSLKLVSPWGGEWCVVAARVAAGLGGAAAWALSPLLAREMCSERYRGAAVSALTVAHNLGILLMYLAADLAVAHRTVLWWCAGLSLLHCMAFCFLPESPSFLAASGKLEEARAAVAWFRGLEADAPALAAEMHALPPLDDGQSSWSLAREMLSDRQRRRAFTIGAIAVVGQETCGVLAILQYAERVFALARATVTPLAEATTVTPLAEATTVTPLTAATTVTPLTALGVVQLIMSVLSLYLVERVGRRPLLVWSSWVAVAALAVAAWSAGGVLGAARGVVLAGAVSVAVAADAVGLQPTPYALLADMFPYQYRSCAMMLATLGACAGNAVEVAVFPLAAAAGLRAALALAAALTLLYAAFVALAVPETRGRTPQQIYDVLGPHPPPLPLPLPLPSPPTLRECCVSRL